MITIQQISKNFGRVPVIKDVSFYLSSGEIVGLIGPSGGGKTVLLKLLAGIIEPSSGSVIQKNPDGTASPIDVGFAFQEGGLFDSMSVVENVAFPLLSGRAGREGVSRNDALQRAYDILKEVGLQHAYLKLPGELSGGMRRRVGLARALVSRPDLVLLDDPTGGLDPVAASVIMNLILHLQSLTGSTTVMVSHDIRRLLPRVKRVLALFDGSLVCSVPAAALPDAAPDFVVQFLKTRYTFDAPGAHELRTGEMKVH